MAFKTTEWEYSNEVDNTQIDPVEGDQYLLIKDAKYSDEKAEYSITVESLNNHAEFVLRYWMCSLDDGGARIENSKSKATLITLGKALAGVPIGRPNPVDIIGGVVRADVSMSKPNAKGNSYPRVYAFHPVPESVALGFGLIEQFALPDE